MNDNLTLCRLYGGSHLYGLNTPDSDVDYRGVFVNTDPKFILGTGRFEESRKQNPSEKIDIVYKELSHWVRLLNQGNTEAYEILFAARSVFVEYNSIMDLYRDTPFRLIDSRKLFNCLRGYAQSEFRLAKGERVGVLGSKRKMALDKYGYSHRNASHLLRLLQTGIYFFKYNRYVVNCKDFEPHIWQYILSVKTRPETYNVEMLEADYIQLERDLVSAYESRKITHSFDEKYVNKLLLETYLPFLQGSATQIS